MNLQKFFSAWGNEGYGEIMREVDERDGKGANIDSRGTKI